ncbi:ubiquinol-cytochrome c reductase core subunit 1 [Phycomyces blakesleeanus NRRL 1555(-)]|uniref:Ubiquinol-cytochrome c reductase core subunit 1 n=1 Tax=Phycomyces blakesleeanus (strain ATCC 8743b / DSM 1359 / FGSC 10004 / NBRC 33097 / NRRL 1555) TaxID=763407 RepID=A0A167MFT9_PHYB8|nr:ubiquinol-cytochrome c reductase core subunit 1 [Phycomyces blakesleeanus NRRL 1555(-)]OAD72736.1 ubiquinol-cytochrome c reductase core subunit 1 [Phycomyces blakesleeanus NRRL 1555(-)]|eukprot:XP_018290776.1 ubiquinol-cytochrome c reductase core subunit 1 [Phycomyces blakesleeanus NRRL 1555(-)]
MTFIHSEEWISASNGTFNEFKIPIEKPENDKRLYRVIELLNGLQVTIISDPETDRSSAALSVQVGSMNSPFNLQGLAHFCEHLLFMGTKKYPKENEYSSYISDYSGYINAYTRTDATVYYFEVGDKGLKGALDRFSRFFVDPLFTESCTERELKAVDSEHKKNLQSDCWRICQVERSLCSPEHPWNTFSIGNLETLKESPERLGLNVREELLKFHNKFYSANIMKLCVIGKESLDDLTKWVVEMFSIIPNKKIDLPTFGDNPLTSKELTTQVYIKSIRNDHYIILKFPFPDQSQYYDSRPSEYIISLLNHEGSGSCIFYLKKKGWVTSLNSSLCNEARGIVFFQIYIELTKKGLDYHEEVVLTLFQYIEMIKSAGVQKWIFEEAQKMGSIGFRFSKKLWPSDDTKKIVETMEDNIPPQLYISSSATLIRYDPELIKKHLYFLAPDNFRYIIVSQVFPADIKCSQTERWYKTPYDVQNFSPEFKEVSIKLTLSQQKLKNPGTNAAFKLPTKNDLIPTKFETGSISKERQKQPLLIKEEPGLRLWYKRDDTFSIPKTYLWANLKNPLGYCTPRHTVLLMIYTSMINKAMTEYTYNAELAGLTYQLYCSFDSLTIHLAGYSDKLPLLFDKLLYTMTHLVIDNDQFEIRKDELKRSYENIFVGSPFNYIDIYVSVLIRDFIWEYKELWPELTELKPDDVLNFYPTFLKTLNVEGLVHGAMGQSDAVSLFDAIKTTINSKPLVPSQLINSRSIYLPEGQHFVHQIPASDPEDVNSAILYYIQVCKPTNIRLYILLILVQHIAQEPIFDHLRTKEQLGYAVYSEVYIEYGITGLTITVQSERDPIYLENRVEVFLDKLREIIVDMTYEEYKTQVDSIVNAKKQKFRSIYQEASEYWSHIDSGSHEFDRNLKEITEIEKIEKADLLDFFDVYINPNSPRYSKLSIHIQAQKKFAREVCQHDAESVLEIWLSENPATCISDKISTKKTEETIDISSRDHTKLASGTTFITDITRFKSEMSLSPARLSSYKFNYP